MRLLQVDLAACSAFGGVFGTLPFPPQGLGGSGTRHNYSKPVMSAIRLTLCFSCIALHVHLQGRHDSGWGAFGTLPFHVQGLGGPRSRDFIHIALVYCCFLVLFIFRFYYYYFLNFFCFLFRDDSLVSRPLLK